ncbi:MAG TPA: FAD-dependent oxidoreductase, partial [Burkholderiales bacterium]|nr:FAD-dependent oxidoreductase [Burkholderiales bacterium]
MGQSRRDFIKWLSASAGLAAVSGCATTDEGGRAGRVVVIGGGFAGGTAARYMRLWAPDIAVTLVERNANFISCPMSNMVLGGNTRIENLTMGYDGLRRLGVKLMRDEAVAIDAAKRQVRLASGSTLEYDRLIVAPGIDFLDAIPGLRSPEAQ